MQIRTLAAIRHRMLVPALSAIALASTATIATAADSIDDSFAPPTRAVPTLAMGDDIAVPTRARASSSHAPSHGRHAAPHTVRHGTPLVASERPPRSSPVLAKGAGQAEPRASRLGAGHMFPPRGFPKW